MSSWPMIYGTVVSIHSTGEERYAEVVLDTACEIEQARPRLRVDFDSLEQLLRVAKAGRVALSVRPTIAGGESP